MTSSSRDAALAHLERHFDDHLDALRALVRIGGVSAEPPPNPTLAKSAAAVVAQMQAAGLERCRVIEVPDAHPYAYGEWLGAPGAPTLLLYGHHDVQPVGRLDRWETPPFEPTPRADGRLYGRGAVDDKAGVMAHVAACAAWLRGPGALPVNVKLIVEGEEEIGSGHLEAFLQAHRELLQADCIVLTDTANLDEGVPALTVSLRGIVAVTVEVRAIERPLHSGMWGGPVPDATLGLCRALGAPVDADGQVAAPLRAGVRPPDDAARARLEAIPFDEARFRADAGLLPGVELVGDASMPVYGRLWREPALSVVALEARPFKGSTNQIVESARARVSVRTVPDQDAAEVEAALVALLRENVPWGLELRVTPEASARWWSTVPDGPAFDAAARAMAAGYGREGFYIGCGGTIPFVEPFANAFGGVPALLTGVEDPRCAAHAENESLSVQDFQSAARTAVHLYAELATALDHRA